MEHSRFDDLTRSIVASSSRRGLLRGAVGSLVGAVGLGLGIGGAEAAQKAAACVDLGKNCLTKRGTKRKCCGGATCQGQTCRCPGNQKQCQNKCIARNDCCTTDDCPEGRQCRQGACVCRGSRRECPDGSCVPENGCCDTGECTNPIKPVCRDGRCRCQETNGTCAANEECCSDVCTCQQAGRPAFPDVNECQAPSFSQNFNQDLDGWYAFEDATRTFFDPGEGGTITRFGNRARIAPGGPTPTDLTAVTLWGGYSTVFPAGGFTTSLDIFLDPELAPAGQKFSYSVAINDTTNCAYANEYMFQGGRTGDDFCVLGGGGTGTDPCDPGSETIENAGFYTFIHNFADNGGQLDVTLTVFDADGVEVLSENFPNQGAIAGFGGNRYGWFPRNDFDPLTIDNSSRQSGGVGGAGRKKNRGR